MTSLKIVLLYFLALISVTVAQNYISETYNPNPEGKFSFPNHAANNARFPRQSSNEDYKTDGGHGENYQGVIGPVHTFVKTDRNAHFKWGVRHYVDQSNSGHH